MILTKKYISKFSAKGYSIPSLHCLIIDSFISPQVAITRAFSNFEKIMYI